MSEPPRIDKEYLRFQWSHRHPLHLKLVRIFNALMAAVPFRIKYGIGLRFRRSKPPYSLLRSDSVVVQVGAPRDTLRAGRSRAMYFALLVQPHGRLVVVEADPESARSFEEAAAARGLKGVTVCTKAAWSERAELNLHFKNSHPAAGFVEDCADYTEDEARQFAVASIPADSLDNILASLTPDSEQVRLLSVTTNGAEEKALEGARGQLAKGVAYISLARTGPKLDELMRSLGYQHFAHDDRGFTFCRTNAPAAASENSGP
ncbi:MAG: FkbM family methyltransferase [Acidobacteriota bacterium]|nr:FkbM family methyltransferase [Acidobacteriota bacterium]